MAKDKNKQIVSDLKEKIAKSKSITIADYIGLSAPDINDLRQKMKDTDAEVTVAKNTLIKIALKEENLHSKEIEKDLEGNTALIFSYKDAVQPIKVLFDFIKRVELPRIKSAIFEGVYTSGDKVEVISTLPGKEQLVGRFLGGLKSPVSGFAMVLNGVQRKFVYALAGIAEKKNQKS